MGLESEFNFGIFLIDLFIFLKPVFWVVDDYDSYLKQAVRVGNNSFIFLCCCCFRFESSDKMTKKSFRVYGTDWRTTEILFMLQETWVREVTDSLLKCAPHVFLTKSSLTKASKGTGLASKHLLSSVSHSRQGRRSSVQVRKTFCRVESGVTGIGLLGLVATGGFHLVGLVSYANQASLCMALEFFSSHTQWN